MSDVITNVVPTGPYGTTTINNGGLIVGSPRGSGFLDTNYAFGVGYSGVNSTASTIPSTGIVFAKYNNSFTGCPPCN